MINANKWINSIRKPNQNINSNSNLINHDKWENTIPRVKKYNSVKKYSLISIFFIFGLALVSAVKNESRSLQKEINNLEASIKIIKFNLDQAILDNEVIMSPENISSLAKVYLDEDLLTYKRSQIEKLNERDDLLNYQVLLAKVPASKEKKKKITENIKVEVVKKIEKKKQEIQYLQKIYSNPKEIPDEIKTKVARTIQEKKSELKSMYESPEIILSKDKIGRWGIIQVVKLFLGIPIVPGR